MDRRDGNRKLREYGLDLLYLVDSTYFRFFENLWFGLKNFTKQHELLWGTLRWSV